MGLANKNNKITLSLLLTFFLTILFSNISLAEDQTQNYKLGEGLRLAEIQFSGYLTVNGKIPNKGDSELVVDDLSLFFNARFHKLFNPFFEAEIAETPIYVQGHDLFKGKDAKLVLERLYNDSRLSNQLTLRLGKSLDPIGEWNGIHAGPLVPTSTRPLTTFRSFSEFITGAAFIYTPLTESLPTVNIYWQPEGDLFHNKDSIPNRDFHNIKGANLTWGWGFENKLGLAFQTADLSPAHQPLSERQNLLGLNLHLVKGDFDLQSEFTYVWLKNPAYIRKRDDETGLYVQGLYNLDEKWALFARFEYFQDRDFLKSSNNAVFGLKYSPIGPVVWKLEYVEQWGQELEISSGVVASFSVLF